MTATDSSASDPLTAAELGPVEHIQLQAMNYTPRHFTLRETRHLFLLDPPYQRGSVWDTPRRQRLIRSMLSGIPTGAIILNNRAEAGWRDIHYAVVDGKQRIETLRAFEDDELAIPAAWLSESEIETSSDGFVLFSGTSIPFQRRWVHRPLATYEARVATVEAEAEIFRLVNTGGVDQTDADLAAAAAIEAG